MGLDFRGPIISIFPEEKEWREKRRRRTFRSTEFVRAELNDRIARTRSRCANGESYPCEKNKRKRSETGFLLTAARSVLGLRKTGRARPARPEKTVSRRRRNRDREREKKRRKERNLDYDNTRSPFSAASPRRGPRDPPSPIPPPVPCIRPRRPPCRSSCPLRVCVSHVPSNAKSLMSHDFVTTLAPLQREKDSATG